MLPSGAMDTTPPRQPSLLRNILLNIGARGGLVVLALLTVPALVHRLGTDGYGVYILATSLGGLLAVLDFGLTPASITLLSAAWHRGDLRRIEQVVGTAFTIYLLLGAVGAGAVAMLAPWVVSDLLHVPHGLRDAAVACLILSSLGFALNLWLAVFNAIPYALERYDLVAARLLAIAGATTVAILAYAAAGGVLQGFMVINVAGTAISVALFYAASRVLLPGVHLRPGFDRQAFRDLASFSLVKFAGTIGGVFTFQPGF